MNRRSTYRYREGVLAPCVASTTTLINLSGEQTVNGVNVVSGDRVIVKNQSDSTENAVYIVDTGPWRRSEEFNRAGQILSGTVVVDESVDNVWKISFSGTFTPGVTLITFSDIFQVSTPPANSTDTLALQAESVTLPKLARQASGYLLIGKGTGADMAAVAVSGDVTISNTGVVTIGAGKITQSMLASNIVDVSQLARQASGYILVGKGTTANTAFVAVSGDMTISNTGVVSIGNSKITSNMIASEAVTVSKIPDGEITEAKLAAAVQTKLNTTSVTSSVVVDGYTATGVSSYTMTISSSAHRIEMWADCSTSGVGSDYIYVKPNGNYDDRIQIGIDGTTVRFRLVMERHYREDGTGRNQWCCTLVTDNDGTTDVQSRPWTDTDAYPPPDGSITSIEVTSNHSTMDINFLHVKEYT